MPAIHEIATITSKGQITLPKAIRQALGVSPGSKVSFDFIGERVVVSRVESEHHKDPAIKSFLSILEKDIKTGRHVSTLPEDLARSILAALANPVDLDEDIVGDVAL